MTPIADMIREMTSAGVGMDVILIAVEAMEKASIPQIPRNSTESAEEKRKRKDRERKRNSTEIPRNSMDSTEIPNDVSISKVIKKDRERQNRGTRIAPDWSLSDGDRSFAKGEGFSEFEAEREAQKFRDFWIACAGAKGVKLDWTATWRQWIRNGADRAGKRPAPSGSPSEEINWDQVLTSYKQFGHWSRFAGPGPDSPACKAPPEMLEKYELRTQ